MRSAATLLGLFVLGSLAFTACDGDDDTVSGTGGSSGSGGTAAKGGTAGTSGSKPEGGESGTTGGSGGKGGNNGGGGTSSGKGGTSGKGGASASGGNGTGGGAGESGAGVAGLAGDGTGGTTGGTLGASGAGAGGDAGNNGGEAGSGGPAPSAKACSYECTADEDCDPGNQITCVSGLCLDATRACNTREDCVGWASTGLAAESCTQDTDCEFNADFGDLCMNVGGAGLCLNIPDGSDCLFGGQPTVVTKFGSTDTATVCLELAGSCDARQCFKGCASNTDCTGVSSDRKRGPICNTETGKCGGCTGDGDCGGPGTSHCNVDTGVCGCQVSNDCAGLASAGLDTCVAGKCGCSANSCTTFPSATPVCE